MSTATEEIAGQIDARVEKIQAEIRKLEQARAALTGIVAERKTARPRTRDHAPSKRAVARRKVLEQMKSERENRREKLKVVLDHLESGPVPPPSKRRRASRGSRPRQILDLIEAKPGISTGGLVKAIAGVNGPHVYQVVRKLADAGEIAGSHKGWSREGLTAE